MKKVAIFTLNGYFNYGNRLQNYALQEVIKSLGFKVETVVINIENKNQKVNLVYKLKKSILSPGKAYNVVLKKLKSSVNKKVDKKRTEAFKNFSQSYINEVFIKVNDRFQMEVINKYDFFVTGSDQVWNPFYINGSSINFLTFAPKEKRISYAPSFGISSIPLEYQEDYKKWILEMKSLSVREKEGAKIIKNLTGRDAEVLIDPTMMLPKEKWLSISKKSPYKPNKRYILTYFLGNLSEEYKKKIKNISDLNNLKIIRLNDVKESRLYTSDPSEFIDFISDASLVCTDSFHGAVFSILLEKPFVVFERIGKAPSMNSRLETLLSTFKLESRFFQNIKTNDELFNVDFSHVSPILQCERQKSISYLKNAFELK